MSSPVQLGTPAAFARSSGGRSGGGSFSRPSSSGRSSSGSSSSRSSSPRRVPSTINRDAGSSDWSRPRSAPVIVPVPQAPIRTSTYSSGSQSAGLMSLLPLLIVLGGGGLLLLLLIKGSSSKVPNPYAEIDNDKVTVTKLQVALLATARTIQKDLTELSLNIDTSTSEGLLQLLQEAALALLRHPEYWTHVYGDSQTVNSRDAAQQRFNQLSIAERSKFSEETLVNVAGKVRQTQMKKPSLDESATYIVVTLLIGTANDHPLFDTVNTPETLKQTLEAIAAFPADYLFVVELLWSPQDESDSLTYDELLTEYTDMRQI